MDIYYSTEDKYIRAVQKLDYGYAAKAKRLLSEILEEEPDNGRAHYQLARIAWWKLRDAEMTRRHLYYAKRFAPGFTPAWYFLVNVLLETRAHEQLLAVAAEAITVPGISHSWVYFLCALSHEQQLQLGEATRFAEKALQHSICEDESGEVKLALARIRRKREAAKPFLYDTGTATD
ncbi:MAG TPA: hypothetical protein VFU15_09415 [Bacteroidia bacterium]|nr:hypothetical protein [Bacteroidia bacterium]